MKILHTVHRYAPYVGGSEEVVKQLSERLVQWGHEVTVATTPSSERKSKTINGVTIEEFDCSGDLVQGIQGESERYRAFVQNGKFDIIMSYGAQIWATDLLFDLLPILSSKTVVVPLGFYRLPDPRYKKYFQAMPGILKQYDSVIYLSEMSPDKQFADSHQLKNGIVIPNGAQVSEFDTVEKGLFRKKHHLENEFFVLTVSNHSEVKNHPLFWKCVRTLNGENVRFVLIGNAMSTGLRKWVKECYSFCRMKGKYYNSMVLEDIPRNEVIQAFVDADVFLFTSRFECSPLVMFEAFASKTLFVTTDCGNVRDFSNCLKIFNNGEEASTIIKDYRNSPTQYLDLINRGYEYVSRNLNWDIIARRYEQLYLQLCR